jgi:hypothetical protein
MLFFEALKNEINQYIERLRNLAETYLRIKFINKMNFIIQPL